MSFCPRGFSRRLSLVSLTVIALTSWAIAQTAANRGRTYKADEHGFVRIRPEEVQWSGAAGGMQTAVLAGDPNRAGPYVMRVKFPPGAMTRPHKHSQDRFVTVISGTWHTGTSEKFEPANTVPLPAGSFMLHPAGAVHYDGARDDEAIVQVIGIGPVTTEYLAAPASSMEPAR